MEVWRGEAWEDPRHLSRDHVVRGRAVVPFFAVAASLARSRDLGRFRVCLWPGLLSCQLDKSAWAAALSKAEFSRASERALPFLFDQVTRDQLVPFSVGTIPTFFNSKSSETS